MPKRSAGTRCIHGRLVLPGGLPAKLSRAAVSLIDASYADASATALAETVLQVTAPLSGPIEFCLGGVPPREPPRRRWVFDATVTADRDGHLAAGDYVLAHTVEYLERPRRGPVSLRMQRVN
jgi:uncharacterized lipoprotein YbaY